MGIIYDKNATEKELYSAYGLTVYGKENRYDSVFSPDVRSVYITLRISNGEQNLVDEYLGNNCIFPDVFKRTIDNFLWWLSYDQPDTYDIEKAICKSLCSSDCLFNTRIENRKRAEKQVKEQMELRWNRIAEQKHLLHKVQKICMDNGWMLYANKYPDYLDCAIFNPLTGKAIEILGDNIIKCNTAQINSYKDFCKKCPDNGDLRLIAEGDLQSVYEEVIK